MLSFCLCHGYDWIHGLGFGICIWTWAVRLTVQWVSWYRPCLDSRLTRGAQADSTLTWSPACQGRCCKSRVCSQGQVRWTNALRLLHFHKSSLLKEDRSHLAFSLAKFSSWCLKFCHKAPQSPRGWRRPDPQCPGWWMASPPSQPGTLGWPQVYWCSLMACNSEGASNLIFVYLCYGKIAFLNCSYKPSMGLLEGPW